jgi:hypothetical protein
MSTSSPSDSADRFLVGGGVPACLKPGYSSRRKFLGTTGLAATGVIIGAPRSQGAFFGLIGDKPVPGIPHSWIQAKGTDVTRYARYIQSLNLRNITPRMVLAPHFKSRGSVPNSLPPKSYWKSLGPTLKAIDQVVTRIGCPLKEIASAYRSPSYNRAVGGRTKSYHMQNMACDIKIHGVSTYQVAAAAKEIRNKGHFKGGIGRYSAFVHLDTRGINVDW